MANELRFEGRVAIVTGAGGGLGRAHALLLAARGARVVVNDLGGSATGTGESTSAADRVVAEIRERGGEAVASYDSVEAGERIVQTALDHFGRIDIVVNNAGILRDVTFHKMTVDDWTLVQKVHLEGAFRVTHAAWPHLREAGYGRVIFTTSAAGLYGNFGQANYAAAKMALVGFASTLALEGKKRGIHANVIAPLAGSRLTETILPKDMIDALDPAYVSPLVAWLCHESCEENGGVFEVGGGFFAKVRLERAKGKVFRLGREISPERVATAWPEITSFDGATHPADVTQAFEPIMANVAAGKSRGGNEFIDVDEALGQELPTTTTSHTPRDVALYALAVGCGTQPTEPSELALVYEGHAGGLRALPTFGAIPVLNAMMQLAASGKQTRGLRYGFDRVLHGEQLLEMKKVLPTSGTLTHKARIKDIFDKGKHALVVTETRTYDEAGDEVLRSEVTTFVRGAGGFGGERGPAAESFAPPARDPDAEITEATLPSQALLYRLNGDWNPLHADPDFARAFGFDRPILHGLCTFGFAGRHLVKSFAKNDPRYLKSIRARFSDSVFPGETLRTRMWKDGDRVLFETAVVERDKVVLSAGVATFWSELPAARAGAGAPASTATKGADAQPSQTQAAPAAGTSRAIFAAIADHVRASPDLVAQVGTKFVLRLSSPDSVWTLDLKQAPGGVREGAEDGADVTLSLSDEDWVGITTGKADAQKLFFAGKLKITGNMMAAQKLAFLKKMSPGGASSGASGTASGAAPASKSEASAATGTGTASKASAAPRIFAKLAERLASDRGIAAETPALLEIRLRDPESTWTVDLRTAPGSVREGKASGATTVLTLDEASLEALARGEAKPQDLYQHGKLRVDGDLRPARALGFLSGLGT